MLHEGVTWPVGGEGEVALRWTEMRMVEWMCGVELQDGIPGRGLRERLALWILSATTQVSRYQKGITKTNLDFLEQETVNGSGISLAIYKSAPRHRQITMPALHMMFFSVSGHRKVIPYPGKSWN